MLHLLSDSPGKASVITLMEKEVFRTAMDGARG
jgi:hypothetical protein